MDQERPKALLEKSARLATVAIDDHAGDTVKSSTTSLHLWGLSVESRNGIPGNP